MPNKRESTGNRQLDAADQSRLDEAVAERAWFRDQRPARWVNTLFHACNALLGPRPTHETATVFWLRLFATLSELRKVLESEVTAQEQELGGSLASFASPTPTLVARRAVLSAIAALRNEFSDDECVYLHYRRDTEAHIWQEFYELRENTRRPGTLIETRRYDLIGRDLRHDDANSRTQTVIASYRRSKEEGMVDELRIAVDMAGRVAPHASAILDAVITLANQLGVHLQR